MDVEVLTMRVSSLGVGRVSWTPTRALLYRWRWLKALEQVVFTVTRGARPETPKP